MEKYKNFLLVGKTEGYSYLFLLLIAVPMKYMMGIPEAVRYTGMIHGILFIAFMFLILKLWMDKAFTFKQAVYAFLLSLVPFGTFYLHKLIKLQDQSS